jgi:hypothetical protein
MVTSSSLQLLLLRRGNRSVTETPLHALHCLPRMLQQFGEFARSILAFAAIGVPAAIVNSGLKYMQKKIELAFQVCQPVN